MRAYSLDLRTHLVHAVQAGVSKSEAARIFGVSIRTVERSLRQGATTGDLAARPIPGRPRVIPPEQEVELDAQLRAHADATLVQHCQLWQQTHGAPVSLATMSRAIARVGLSIHGCKWALPQKVGKRLAASLLVG